MKYPYPERTPHPQFALVADGGTDVVNCDNLDRPEILVDESLDRVRESHERIDIDELAWLGWVRDILIDTTERSVVVDTKTRPR